MRLLCSWKPAQSRYVKIKKNCYFYKTTQIVAENLTNSITDPENVDTLKESHIVPLLHYMYTKYNVMN